MASDQVLNKLNVVSPKQEHKGGPIPKIMDELALKRGEERA